MSGIFDWYRKPVEERVDIVFQAQMEKVVKSICGWYRGLGELSRAMTRIRGDD